MKIDKDLLTLLGFVENIINQASFKTRRQRLMEQEKPKATAAYGGTPIRIILAKAMREEFLRVAKRREIQGRTKSMLPFYTEDDLEEHYAAVPEIKD